eukprot:7911078-Pyramimonas_sp.AAC.1
MAQAESPLAAQIIVSPPFCPPLPPIPSSSFSPVICYPSFSRASPAARGREWIYHPKGGTIEDARGGYPGFGICILNDARADKSEQS